MNGFLMSYCPNNHQKTFDPYYACIGLLNLTMFQTDALSVVHLVFINKCWFWRTNRDPSKTQTENYPVQIDVIFYGDHQVGLQFLSLLFKKLIQDL